MEPDPQLVTRLQPFHGDIVTLTQGNDFSRGHVAVGGLDQTVTIYPLNGSSPSEPCFTVQLANVPSCLTFDKDDAVLAIGADNGAIKLWTVKDKQSTQTLSGHRTKVTALEYYQYHNTNLICSGSADTTIRLWDIRKRGTIAKYKGHTKAINVLRFSPDGKYLVSGSDDHQLKVWDLRQGSCISTMAEHGAPVNDIRFHPCEMMFASGGADRQVNFYDFQSFERVSYSNPTTHAISTIKFNIDGSSLFFAAGEVIREIEWEPYKCLRSWSTPFGKSGSMAVAHNKIITCGVKCKNTLVAFALDLNENSEMYQRREALQLKKAHIDKPTRAQSTPQHNNRRIQPNRNNGNNVEHPFESREKLPRSPLPPTTVSSTENTVNLSPIRSSPKKKIIRPTNPQSKPKKDQNDHVPIEIYVGPKVINQQPTTVQAKAVDRPKAIVRPNNSANFDKVESPVDDFAQIKQPNQQVKMSMKEVLGASSSMIQSLQSRNLKLQKAKHLWQRGKIVDVLCSSILDKPTLFDLLSLLLDQHETWTLHIALAASDSCYELCLSKHTNHVRMAYDVIKTILKHFHELLSDAVNQRTALPTITNEERSERCVLIVKRAEEIRDQLELKWRDDKRQLKALYELDLLISAIKS